MANFVKYEDANTLFTKVGTKTNAIEDMVVAAFDDTVAYSTGDLVIYNDGLYVFTTDHAAGAWSASDVTATTIAELIEDVEVEGLTTAQLNTLLGLLD